jgi:tetratricopeptide (TPR) repeat protein
MGDAEKNFKEAIDVNEQNPDNYFNLGNVLLNNEDFEGAHYNFDKAIIADGKNAKFYHAKGLAYQAMAEYINQNNPPSVEAEREEENQIALAIE